MSTLTGSVLPSTRRVDRFFQDLQYLWVGPIFVVSKLFLKLGVRW